MRQGPKAEPGRFPAPDLGEGFTLIEIVVSTGILVFVSSLTFLLLVSGRQLTQKPSHRTEAGYLASETLETLRNYVTANPQRSVGLSWVYNLLGDGNPFRYALLDLQGPAPHLHQLPPGPFKDTLSGTRQYDVDDVDLDPAFDSDGDGINNNDSDYKKVTVTVRWEEQQ